MPHKRKRSPKVVTLSGERFKPTPDVDPMMCELAAEFTCDMVEKAKRFGVIPEKATAAMFLAWCRILVNSDKPEMRKGAQLIAHDFSLKWTKAAYGLHPADQAFMAMAEKRGLL